MTRTNALALCMAAGCAGSAAAQFIGPSTAVAPYILPTAPQVQYWAYAANGDGRPVVSPNETYPRLNNSPVAGTAPYRLVGIPDGQGVFLSPQDLIDGTMSVLVNHELGDSSGIVRDHGSRGALVSLWRVKRDPALPDFLTVVGVQDLTQRAFLWDIAAGAWQAFDNASPMPRYQQATVVGGVNLGAQGWNTTNPDRRGFGRFCSADLAAPSAFRFGSLGTDARIFLNGEEIGSAGRAFAHIATGPAAGDSYELPFHGDYSWENNVASPFPQAKTVVVGLDDSSPGNVYVFVGQKQAAGNDVERAGLQQGTVYGPVVQGVAVVAGQPVEDPAFVLGTSASGRVESKPFTMVSLGDVVTISGAALQARSDSLGVLNFRRPEDGAWDTLNPRRFYFVTTASVGQSSRLWAMDFTDITQPELGGTVTMLGDGSVPSSFAGGLVSSSGATTVEMMDNMCVTKAGLIIIQEDVGSDARLGREWLYDPTTDRITEIGRSDPNRFTAGAPGFLTTNEETSGLVSAEDIIGPGWILDNMQAHYAISGELAEGGQLLAIFAPQISVGVACYANCDGSTSLPLLNALDFSCFLARYRAGEAYANCDASTSAPALNALDFGCFLARYQAGCNN